MSEISDRFFGGRNIAKLFNGLLGWSGSITSGGDDIWMPILDEIRLGEQVLRIEVDGVSIPYKSNYPPLAGHEGKSTKNQQIRQTSGAEQDKPERKKG